jgi:hypothetical protein
MSRCLKPPPRVLVEELFRTSSDSWSRLTPLHVETNGYRAGHMAFQEGHPTRQTCRSHGLTKECEVNARSGGKKKAGLTNGASSSQGQQSPIRSEM